MLEKLSNWLKNLFHTDYVHSEQKSESVKVEKATNVSDNSVLSSKYENLLKEKDLLQQKYDALLSRYKPLEEIQAAYNGLGSETLAQIKNLFPAGALPYLLANGLAGDGCLSALWDAISYMYIEGKEQDTEKLKIIFDYFFSVWNSRHPGKPEYTRLLVKPGQKYGRASQRIVDSRKTDGIISDVLLAGYKDNKGKVIKYSLVRIGE